MSQEIKDTVQPKRGNLLLVDDDKMILKLYSRIFEKHFNVVTSADGTEAIKVLQSKYSPGVIISDQLMPGMTGSEFLEKSISIVPNAVRIILTAEGNTGEIIKYVSQAQAFMYLQKPIKDMDLIQAVRIAFEHFNLGEASKSVFEKLAKKDEEITQKTLLIKKLYFDKKSAIKQLTDSFSKLLSPINSQYHNNHISFVTHLCLGIAHELGLENTEKEELEFSANLHSVVYLNLPEKFSLIDPNDLSDIMKHEFHSIFKNNISIVEQVTILQSFSKHISQIWEHKDGTGFPNKLPGDKISRISQIISVANQYHNMTYGFSNIQNPETGSTGVSAKTTHDREEKHNLAVKYFFKKANWFDSEVVKAFQTFVKRKEFTKITSDADLERLVVSQKPPEKPVVEEVISINKNSQEVIKEKVAEVVSVSKSGLIEKDINVNHLKPGMIVINNLVTKNGFLLVRQDNPIDDDLIQKIQRFEKMGMVGATLKVYIQQEKTEEKTI